MLVRRILAAVVCTVAFTLVADAEPVRGRVTDPDGRPVPGAIVTAVGGAAAPVATITDAEGRFELDLRPGPATVRAWTRGLTAPAVSIGVPSAPLAIQLGVQAVAEALTVTASHLDVPLSASPDSVSVLTREDLDERQIVTLGDALRLVPGVAVARNGGPGTVTSAFPRGGESDFTLVLVDGVRQNGFGGGLDLSQVPIADAERVEVVRGPQSALHGSDAIGGVIQIITTRPGASMASALAEVGGRAFRNASASARADRGLWRVSAAGSYQREEGFTGRAPANGTTVSNDDGEVAQTAATVGVRTAGGLDAGLSFQAVDTQRGAPGPFGSNPVGNFAGIDRVARGLTTRRNLGVHVRQPIGGPTSRVRLRADADVANFDLEFRSAFPSTGGTRRAHGRLQLDAAATASLGASVGADALRESARSTFITAGSRQVPVDRRTQAAFGEVRWQPVGRLSLAAGVRAERITRDALDANPSTFSARPAFAADTVVSVNPKVTAAWTVVDDAAGGVSTRLRAAAGTGIRPPDGFEIAFTDNPGLRPERSRSVEVGLVQTLDGGRVQADLTAFRNGYDDLIISIGRLAATSRYRTDNIANARARGVEASLSWRPVGGVSLRGNYTWLETEILAVDGAPGQAPSPFAVGDPLLRRPRHQGTLDTVWRVARLQSFATVVLRGRTLDIEPSFGASGGRFRNPGYAMVTAGAAWTLGRGVSVHARVLNALDARYEDVYGYPALGRTVYAGLRAALGR